MSGRALAVLPGFLNCGGDAGAVTAGNMAPSFGISRVATPTVFFFPGSGIEFFADKIVFRVDAGDRMHC
jgi:hypothetical protein